MSSRGIHVPFVSRFPKLKSSKRSIPLIIIHAKEKREQGQ